MNFKTALLTTAAVMMTSTAAMAHHTNKKMETKAPMMMADINSPFYIPAEGKMLSETSLEYNRLNTNEGNFNEGWYAKQSLSYGVSDNMSVFASIGNTFDNTVMETSNAYNNSHNFDYTVGMKYNHNMDKIKTQFSIAYNTFQPKSFVTEGNESSNWNKYVELGAKVGYKMDCGCLPYISFNANYGLNTVDGAKLNVWNSPNQAHFTYSTYAGIYNSYDMFSTDMGIRWDNIRNNNGVNDTASRDDVYLQAAVNYNLSDTMSVGLYGEYLVGDSYMAEIDYDYTVGANLKVAF